MSLISKYKDKDGEYRPEPIEEGKINWAGMDAADFLWCHVLNMCGCYIPDEGLKFLHKVLDWCNNRDKSSSEWDALEDPGFLFTLYWLDKEDITEHGSSVGGSCLSEKGRSLLQDLNMIADQTGGKYEYSS